MSVLEYLTRAVDDKPMAAHLYVTDQCNLDCHYCNEYDNSIPHPSGADLQKWMRHIRDLGVSRLVFQGGEPLLHPDIVELTRYAKSLGFYRVSMATNALLLTKEQLGALERAGLDTMQISIDRLTPNASTRKSMKSVTHKLEWFKESKIDLRVSGVLFHDSLEEATRVIDTCVERGIRVHARVVHDDLINHRKLRLHPTVEPLMKAIEYQEGLKKQGAPIHTSWSIIEYEKKMLRGEEMDWTCTAGYKYFFVSAQGKFWLCSQVRTEKHILDVTSEDLRSYNTKKDCQKGCGVYCIVDTSLGVSHPAEYIAREAQGEVMAKLAQLRRGKKPVVAAH
jgi:MoaA/NifB/PqqE/SkfB family radical SAM enzyme